MRVRFSLWFPVSFSKAICFLRILMGLLCYCFGPDYILSLDLLFRDSIELKRPQGNLHWEILQWANVEFP